MSTSVKASNRPDAIRAALAKFSAGEAAEGVRERHEALYLPPERKKTGPRATERTVPMSVLNLSMPRTGTMSMQRALNILGYRCYHSTIFYSRLDDCALWDAAMDAKFRGKGSLYTRKDWDRILGDFSAVSADVPPVVFAEELVEMYPDAKVILVERDIESWFRSFSGTVTSSVWSPLMNRIADWDPWFTGPLRDTHLRWVRLWFKANSQDEMDAISRTTFRRHYELVRRVTPPERLLEYRLGDGWTPLCEFLGRDVPDCPFPHVNDGDELWEMLVIITRRGMWNVIRRALLWSGVGTAVLMALWWVWRKET